MPALERWGTTQSDRIIQPVVMTTGHTICRHIGYPYRGSVNALVEARSAFNQMCSTCHGSDGLGGAVISIVDADSDREHVRSAMGTSDHMTLDRENPVTNSQSSTL